MDLIYVFVLLNLAHFLGDYSHLSMKFMLSAKERGRPAFPIIIHAGVHASLVFIFMIPFFDLDKTMVAAVFQLATHFLIDLAKGRLSGFFRSLRHSNNRVTGICSVPISSCTTWS